jgi:hypothetical protein
VACIDPQRPCYHTGGGTGHPSDGSEQVAADIPRPEIDAMKMTLRQPLLVLPLALLAACNEQSLPTGNVEGPLFSVTTSELSPWFTEDFNAGASALLELTKYEDRQVVPDYSAGDARFGGWDDFDRTYLRTIRSDYHLQDFVAEATVTVVSDQEVWGGAGMAFFGFGQGEGSVDSFFEPVTSPVAYARIMPTDFSGELGVHTDGPYYQIENGAGDGTHRVRMTYSAGPRELTFAIHKNWTGGPFVATHTIGPISLGEQFGETNSHIFLGGAGGVRFDDLVVSAPPFKSACTFTVNKKGEHVATVTWQHATPGVTLQRVSIGGTSTELSRGPTSDGGWIVKLKAAGTPNYTLLGGARRGDTSTSLVEDAACTSAS